MIKEFIEFPELERCVGKWFQFLSPNTWTTLSLCFSAIAFCFVFYGFTMWGMVFFLISALLDGIDGKVARYTRRATPIGAFWDGTVDRMVDMLFILCFFFLDFPAEPMFLHVFLFLLLFFTLMPPFIVAYANHRLAVPDPSEKEIWRFAFRVEYLVFFLLVILLNKYSITLSYYALWAGFILMAATFVQSIILVFIKSKKYKGNLTDGH